MVEVTYRQGDWIDRLSEEKLKEKIRSGLLDIGFIKKPEDGEFVNITRHPYAYVLYDLKHQKNMELIREYYGSQGIYLHGRFGNFEYWNMDRVLREGKNLAGRILKEGQA